MWKRSCRRRCSKIEEKPDKEVQMEVRVAGGEGREKGDVRGIKMVTKEVDEEMDNCYEDMMDEEVGGVNG